jgi:uncharacterized protein YecE (DUF72 family)
MELYLGTGGFSNRDWLGLIYPEGTRPERFLEHYARHFNAVELNSSFYGVPGIKAFEGMVRKSEARVRFSVKAHRSLTHERKLDPDMVARHRESVQPLRDVGMLGPFLLQFPYAFHRTPKNRLYLRDLATAFEGEAVAVEFRHASWDRDEVRAAFAAVGLAWASVDYPPLRGLPSSGFHATGDVAYLRLHGRNEKSWWDGKSASERHDYRYTSDELRPWVQAIVEAGGELTQVYLMMQNTTKGHAIANLRMLRELFGEAGVEADVRL